MDVDALTRTARSLYEQQADSLLSGIGALVEEYRDILGPRAGRRRWNGRDAVLITYADTVTGSGAPPLHTLASFLDETVGDAVSTVHVLPFYPWTSDDGFSVVDHRAVDPALGTWGDVEALAERRSVMADLVLNHVSASSDWFTAFLAGDPELEGWFITPGEDADLSRVVRPRTSPLLTEVDTVTGPRQVWTTFSADQIDLNVAHPPVMLALLRTLLEQVAHGIDVIRLDAVTYVWKIPGTTCVNLPQTHAVVRLIRGVLDAVAPDVTLITETNVPHDENIAYFGERENEAQLVYDFALPPLVLHAFLTQDGSTLSRWATELRTVSPETHFLNFLASHDGIGLRGAECILRPDDLQALAHRTEAHGGHVGHRSAPDGTAVPYELNVNYYDALNDPADGDDDAAVTRFLTAHAIMLALPGVPALYVHSLLGSRGDPDAVARTGRPRSINRARLDHETLRAELADPSSRRARVLAGLRRMLGARRANACFDPHAPFAVVEADPGLLVVDRGDGRDRVRCVHNVTHRPLPVPGGKGRDLLTGEDTDVVPAWDTRWVVGC